MEEDGEAALSCNANSSVAFCCCVLLAAQIWRLLGRSSMGTGMNILVAVVVVEKRVGEDVEMLCTHDGRNVVDCAPTKGSDSRRIYIRSALHRARDCLSIAHTTTRNF